MDKKLKKQIDDIETCSVCGEKGTLIPPPEIIKENGRKFQIVKFKCPNNHEFTRKIELK